MYTLENFDKVDLEEFLFQVEASFNIQLDWESLSVKMTFQELCKHITGKLSGQQTDDCTTQQAFYKLRASIVETLNLSPKEISINTPLDKLMTRKTRISDLKKITQRMGFESLSLQAPKLVLSFLSASWLASIIKLFFNWEVGLIGICFSFLGSWIAEKYGKELYLDTLGDWARLLTREHYFKSRKNPLTFNKNEVEKILTDWFCECFGVEKSELLGKTVH